MRWFLSSLPIAFGLVVHGLTLAVAFGFVRDCIQTGRFRHRSGMPVIGPLAISFGLWLCPIRVPVWVYLVPWGLELAALLLSFAVRRATHAKPV